MSNASDFIIEDGILSGYTGLDPVVFIPRGVTKIGYGAFQHCKLAEKIVVPTGVIVIDKFAFWGCSNLREVKLPEGLTDIGWFAFQECSSLESIIIPEGVTSIGLQTFNECEKLADVTIPESVTKIESVAFGNCKSLADIVLPSRLEYLGDGVFDGCSSLKQLTIPECVNRIGKLTFRDCKALEVLSIPETTMEIGNGCLRGCKPICIALSDKSAEISTDDRDCCMIRIHSWTPAVTKLIQGCQIERIVTDDLAHIPAKYQLKAALNALEETGWNPDSPLGNSVLDYTTKNQGKLRAIAFDHPKLLQFLCEHTLIKAKDIDDCLAEAENRGSVELKMLLLNYQNKLGFKQVNAARKKRMHEQEDYSEALVNRIAARDPSQGIRGMTFAMTGKLSDVWASRQEVQAYLEFYGAKFDSSITKKTDYLVTNDVKSRSEKNIKAAELGVPTITEDEFNLMIGKRFRNQKQIEIPSWLHAIPDKAFYECTKLTSIIIPETVTSIGDYAFYRCSGLTNVTIPEKVVSIGSEAFSGCKKLDNVMIPKSVKNIGTRAFAACTALKNLIIEGSTLDIGEYAFSDCKLLTDSDGFVIVDGILFSYNGPAGTIHVPAGVRRIGKEVFKTRRVKDVIIPQGVTSIGDNAFYDCKVLSSVQLPSGLTDIGAYAFMGCVSLTDVVVPEGVITLEDKTFASCEKLRSVTLPQSIRCIHTWTFMNTSRFTIHAPAGSYAEQYAKEKNIPFVAE